MLERGSQARLALEALGELPVQGHLGREDLEGNAASETGFRSTVDDRHGAAADLAVDVVLPGEGMTHLRQQCVIGRANEERGCTRIEDLPPTARAEA